MARRTTGVPCKLDGASSCVPLRTSVCANLGVPVLGTIAFPPDVGEGLFCSHSCCILPVYHSKPPSHSPGKDLALCLWGVLAG